MESVYKARSTKEVTEYESVYLDDGTEIIHRSSVYISEPIDFMFTEVTKSKEDKGLVSGWANVALNKDGEPPFEWQDDIIPPSVLEKAAVDFMLKYRGSGEQHIGDAVGEVVESIVFTKEKMAALNIPEGVVPEGWFITVKVRNPEVFAKVKDGTYKMFSIQGKAKKLKL